ncbi:response regulator [bacterium]|nr:response regulator [candidate division CSSED10-310 bacterium]
MEKQKIFVIDDDEFIQRLLKETLEQEGFNVSVFISAEECYRRLGSELPDLFVLDIMLPGQDGFQMCRNLRKQALTQRVPILMLSSKSKVQDRVIGLEAGADDYLAKPFHLDELLARIRVQLRHWMEYSVLEKEHAKVSNASSPPLPKSSIETQRSQGKPPVTPNGDRSPSIKAQREPSRSSITPPTAKNAPAKPSKPITPLPVDHPIPTISPDADFDTRKKFATELYQQRFYDRALQLFEELATEDSKDLYVKKYLEVTRTSMMKHYLQVLGSKDAVPIRTSDRPEDFIGLDFNTQEGFIFSRIDGVTDFKGIVAISGIKPLNAYGILYNLLQSGVIRIK